MKLRELTLPALDIGEAELIKNKIRLNPQGLYGKIMDFVLDNEEYVPEITD